MHSASRTGWKPVLLRKASLALLLLPLLLGAGGDAASDAAARRERIHNMTQAERDRLERNYAAFLSLSPAERQSLRDFHHQLQTDRDAARLQQVLTRYEKWLRTLSPWQRKDLRDADAAAKKMALVRRFKQQQAAADAASSGETDEELPDLTLRDFEAILDVLVNRLNLPPEKLREQESALRRHLYILNEALGARLLRFEGPLFDPIDDELLQDLLDSLPVGPFREKFPTLVRVKDLQKQVLLAKLRSFVIGEIRDNAEVLRPTEEDVQSALNTMPFQVRRNLENLSPDERRRASALFAVTFVVNKEYPHLRPLLPFGRGRFGFSDRGGPGGFPERGGPGRRGDFRRGRDGDRDGPDRRPPREE